MKRKNEKRIKYILREKSTNFKMSSISQIILIKNDKVNYGCSDKLRQSYNYIKSWISSKIAVSPLASYTVPITHNEVKEKEFVCESLSY